MPATDDDEQRAADALAMSAELQARLWTVLNDPTKNWARVPHCAAHGVAEVFTKVLVALAQTDANDVGFNLWLIDQVRQAFLKQIGGVPPTGVNTSTRAN